MLSWGGLARASRRDGAGTHGSCGVAAAIARFAKKVVNHARWRWSRWAPSWQTHFVLAKAIGSEARHPSFNGIRMEWVRRRGDAAWPALVELASELGIEEDWCANKLEAGDEVTIAYVEGEAAGMAWFGRGRLWVDAIHHLMVHDARECSLYNVYVRPRYRGRRLQQKMSQERMAEASIRGMQWMYTVVKSDNKASMKNSRRAGFVPVMRVDALYVRGKPLTMLRRLTYRLPAGRLEFNGFPRTARVHFIRGQIE